MTNSRARPYHHRAMIPLLTLEYAATLFRLIFCFLYVAYYSSFPIRDFIFSLVTLAFLIYQTVCYRNSSFQMAPIRFLSINIGTTSIWLIDLIVVSVVVGVHRGDRLPSFIALAIALVTFFIFVASLIYASVTYHKNKTWTRATRRDIEEVPAMKYPDPHSSDPEVVPVRMA